MLETAPGSRSLATDNDLQLVRSRLCGLARRLSCRPSDAEDIAQAALVVVLEKYRDKPLEEILKLANRICVKLVLNHRRKQPLATPDLLDTAQDPSCDPEELTWRRELSRALVDIIQQLSEKDKSLLRLELQEADTDTICGELAIDRNKLYCWRNRCYAKLRPFLRRIQ